MLVLCSFDFNSKIMWLLSPTKLLLPQTIYLPYQNKTFWPPGKDFSEIFNPSSRKLEAAMDGGACPVKLAYILAFVEFV